MRKRYLRLDGTSIAANLPIARFSGPDRLISTLFWRDSGRDLPPARLWEATLRIRHFHDARFRLFGADLSTDPIGSLLIGIYLAEAESRSIGLDKIATYANIANSIAAWWVTLLQQRGIIQREEDKAINLQQTRSGLDRVEAMLATVYDEPDTAVMLA